MNCGTTSSQSFRIRITPRLSDDSSIPLPGLFAEPQRSITRPEKNRAFRELSVPLNLQPCRTLFDLRVKYLSRRWCNALSPAFFRFSARFLQGQTQLALSHADLGAPSRDSLSDDSVTAARVRTPKSHDSCLSDLRLCAKEASLPHAERLSEGPPQKCRFGLQKIILWDVVGTNCIDIPEKRFGPVRQVECA